MSSLVSTEAVGRSPFADIDNVSRAILSCAATTTIIDHQPWLLADRVLASSDPNSRFSPITITQLAEVEPDGFAIAKAIDRIHAASGIDVSMRPRLAEATITLLAGTALDTIRRQAVIASAQYGVTAPDSLRKKICHLGFSWMKRESVHQKGALALQRYLDTANPVIHDQIKKSVSATAAEARAQAPEKRRLTIDEYKNEGSIRPPYDIGDIRSVWGQIAVKQDLRLCLALGQLQ